MTISLTPEWDAFVSEQVRSGRYASNSEVIRAGLRLLAEQEAQRSREALRTWIQEGIDDLDSGRVVEAKATFSKLHQMIDAMESTPKQAGSPG